MKDFFTATLQCFFGSKCNPRIPRTYEAIVKTDLLDETLTIQYLGDTICSLVKELKKNKVDPSTITIYEIFGDSRELIIPQSMYLDNNGKLLSKTNLCKITSRYGKEESHPSCSFMDRHGESCGPYYDLA